MNQDKFKTNLSKELQNCKICPRLCEVNRFENERGYCGMGRELEISSFGPHFGEEPPLVGWSGSGTIFLTGCSLLCAFCQNYEISHLKEGRAIGIDEMVSIMLSLEERGCHNINFVTPTHFTPHLRESIRMARVQGLRVPIVYNSGGYDSKESLQALDGLVEIYMPDVKFSREESGKRYCKAPDYFQVAKKAVKEMHCQVGDLVIEDGLAVRGLLIRHLVMPGRAGEGKEIIDFLCEEISPNTYINVMAQFHPAFQSGKFSELAQGLNIKEFKEVYNYARDRGLRLSRD